MTRIFSIHSFRGGTGKSNTTANIAAMLALRGLRVGVVDTDIQSPGLHVLFGLKGADIQHSLNDYLWGRLPIGDIPVEVLAGRFPGKVFLIPSSVRPDEIVQVLREGYDMKLLTAAFRDLGQALELDVLLIDTHPGLNEETLFSLAISSAVVIVMRPDQQDYEGTGVTVDIARSLEVPKLMLLVNKAPADFDPKELAARIEKIYGCEVAGVMSHSDDVLKLGSAGLFVLEYPDSDMTASIEHLANRLLGD